MGITESSMFTQQEMVGLDFSYWSRPLFFFSRIGPNSIKPPISPPQLATDSASTLDHHFRHIMSYRYSAYSHNTSFGDSNANCNNVTTNNHNKIVNVNNVIADENLEIMEWLSPLDPGRRHQDVRTRRLDGVGSWLLGTNEFRGWRSNEGEADKAVLFCHGDPGVGKTYLR